MADNKKYKVGITVKEPWDNNISYEQLDMTLFAVENGGDGCAYVAIKPNIGVRPNQDATTWIKATQRGQSIYDYCIEYGLFVGTEEEFAQDYADAVQAAKDAATSATHVEEEVSAAEQGRVSAENARVSAESQRAAAEESRVSSESQRSVNETGRVNAEDSRVVAENGRVVAESQRVSAESTRATNEENRRAEFGGMMRDAETAIGLVDTAMTEAENVDATVDGMIVTITDRNGVSKSVNIGFDIYRTYGSVAAMNADAANVEDGKFVMIATLDPTSTENAQLWVRNSNAATSQNPFTFLSDLDQASSAAWADWMENQKPIIEADHTTAVADHTQAVSDHTNATNDHAVAGQDHTTAGQDHTQAVSDSTRAGQDHLVAEQDHTRAEGDHTTASTDHSTAQSDHTTAGTDHTTASSDHTIASGDHTTALSDHDIASGDHTTAGADHTRAESDHTTASSDHTRAESDHTLAASDHTTASSDHGIASTDHTTAQSDHTQAGDDHTIASADHANATSDHTLAGNDHTRAESDHSTAAEDHTNAAADHTQAGEDHAQYLLDHESIASKANVAPNPTEGNVAALDENGNPIDSGIPSEKVAKADGYYEGMGVGTADNLTGQTERTNDAMYRKSGGSEEITTGTARIGSIKGQTIAWNQWVADGNVEKTKNFGSYTEITYYLGANMTQIVGHVYYLSAIVNTSAPRFILSLEGKIDISFAGIGSSKHYSGIGTSTSAAQTKMGVMRIVNPGSNTDFKTKDVLAIDLTLIYGTGNEPTTPEQFEADYFKWYGKPLVYEPLDASSLRSVQLESLKTTGFNRWDEEWEVGMINQTTGKNTDAVNVTRTVNYIDVFSPITYYIKHNKSNGVRLFFYNAQKILISSNLVMSVSGTFTTPADCKYLRFQYAGTTYNHDICINISDTSRNGEYEPYEEHYVSLPVTTITGKLNGEGESVTILPDGMRSAGTIADEIYTVGDKTYAVKRVGSVDLGTLGWAYDDVLKRFNTDLPTFNKPVSNYVAGNAVSVSYNVVPWRDIENDLTLDKVIVKPYSNTMINLRNLSKTASDLNNGVAAWLSGVTLYYELAEPLVYEIDDFALPKIYLVDGDGTEEQVQKANVQGLAAILTCIYGVDAVKILDKLPQNYISEKSMDNFLAQLNTVTNGVWTKTWNDNTGEWDFSFTPNAQTDNTNTEETI